MANLLSIDEEGRKYKSKVIKESRYSQLYKVRKLVLLDLSLLSVSFNMQAQSSGIKKMWPRVQAAYHEKYPSAAFNQLVQINLKYIGIVDQQNLSIIYIISKKATERIMNSILKSYFEQQLLHTVTLTWSL